MTAMASEPTNPGSPQPCGPRDDAAGRVHSVHLQASRGAWSVAYATSLALHLRFEENFAAAQGGAPVIPRWVNREEQDNAPAALVETVETLEEERIALNFAVLNRRGKALYPGAELSGGAAVEAEMTRELDATERADYLKKAERIAGFVNLRAPVNGAEKKQNRPRLKIRLLLRRGGGILSRPPGLGARLDFRALFGLQLFRHLVAECI